jgi:N-acetyl-anhydromuramyl-L-alanine amidase AmpD
MRIPGVKFVQGRNSYPDADGKHFGIAIHNTSNDATDSGEASYATHRPDGTSAHLYCDADSVTQSLDLSAKAGHAGSVEGNNHAIAVEITGTNSKSRAWWLANVAWDELGRALVWIIRNDPDFAGFQVRRASVAEMRANPKVKAFYSHDDMRQAWGGTTHTDPGPNFPWDRLFQAVNAALNGVEDDMAISQDEFNERMNGWARSKDGKEALALAVLGFDPGRDPKTGSTWPGVVDTTYNDPKGNGTVAPGTALGTLLQRQAAQTQVLSALATRDVVDEAAVAKSLAPLILAGLPPSGQMDQATIEAALRNVFASLAK